MNKLHRLRERLLYTYSEDGHVHALEVELHGHVPLSLRGYLGRRDGRPDAHYVLDAPSPSTPGGSPDA